MIPMLYKSTETEFSTNGLGPLNDALDVTVLREVNGEYTLEMTYPATGKRAEQIDYRTIITATAEPGGNPQPFRVYQVNKTMAGIITVYAHHVAYDLDGFLIPTRAGGGGGVVFPTSPAAELRNFGAEHYGVTPPFQFVNDWIRGTQKIWETPPGPQSIWKLMNGEGSLIEAFGGEWDYDGFDIHYKQRLGADTTRIIRYGVDLVDANQEKNNANVYTGIVPFWKNDEKGQSMELPEGVIWFDLPSRYDYTRLLPVDLTDRFDERPDLQQLRDAATDYALENEARLKFPEVYLKLETIADGLMLGDTVTVRFEKMGIDTQARVMSAVYKPLIDRWESVTLGTPKKNIADTIAKQNGVIVATVKQGELKGILAENNKDAQLTGETKVENITTTGDANMAKLTLAGNDSPVGTQNSVPAVDDVQLTANTLAYPASIRLSKGVWIVEVRARFGTSQTTNSVLNTVGMNNAQSIGEWYNTAYGARRLNTVHVVNLSAPAIYYAVVRSSVANTASVVIQATRLK